MEKPLVSIIILNYNGAHFLPACLDSLNNQTYDESRYEVIVVDNGSNDASVSLLKGNYPWVKIIENENNLGFSRGNNIAIQATTSDFVVLLNNDTAPAKDWLNNLVHIAVDNPDAGMISAHLQMFYDEIELAFSVETFAPKKDTRQLGVQVFNVESTLRQGVVQYLDGFYGWEVHPTLGRFRWMSGHTRLGIPVPHGDGGWKIDFALSAGRDLNTPVRVEIRFQENVIAEWQVQGKNIETYSLELPASVRRYAHSLEQNTGSLIFHSGAGRDRGTYVKDNELFFEVDYGQYSIVEEVFAGCGASLMLRRSMLDEIGSLDDDFFMYYEDTDLSWRARLFGWKVLYAPQAKVRHVHCGTTKEWSPNFIYLTERNRLAMVFKNGAFFHVTRVWGGYGLKVANLAFQAMIRFVGFRPSWRHFASQVRTHFRVILCLMSWMPALFRKRANIMSHRRISPEELKTWFVEGY